MSRKRYQGKFVLYGQRYTIISLWYGLKFIVDQNWKNKIFKLGKVDERIPILHIARLRGKRQNETEI